MDLIIFQVLQAKRALLLLGSYQWIYVPAQECPPLVELWLERKFPGLTFEIRRRRSYTEIMLVGVS